MLSREISLADRPVVIGLSWHVIQAGARTKDEIAKFSRLEGNALFGHVIYSDEGTGAVGLVAPESNITKGISAAAWLAQAVDTSDVHGVLLIEPIGRDQFWLCAIQDGAPLPSYGEKIGPRDTIFQLANSLVKPLREGEKQSVTYTIYSSQYSAEGVINKSFADLVRAIDPRHSKIRQIIGVPRAVKLGLSGAVLLSLGLGGWLFYSDYQTSSKQTRAKAAREANKTKESQVRENRERHQRLLTFREKQREEVLFPIPADTIKQWLVTYNQIMQKPNVAGWDIDRVVCSLPQCTVYWKRATGTNFELADAQLPGISFTGADTAEQTIPAATAPAPRTARGDSIAQLVDQDRANFMMRNLEQWLKNVMLGRAGVLALNFSFAPAAKPVRGQQEVKSINPFVKPDTVLDEFVREYGLGTWTVQGRTLVELNDMAQAVSSPYFLVDELQINKAKTATDWQMSGKYAVRYDDHIKTNNETAPPVQ